MSENQEITKDMTFSEVLQKHPGCAEVMLSKGMHCFGCGMATQETVEQGAKAHGMDDKAVEEMMKEMNDKIKKK